MLCATIAVIVLVAVVGYVVVNGARALNLDFLTQLPAPVGEPGGGMANAIVGTSAVVTGDVPSNAVVAGIPARVIRLRDEPQTFRWR